MDIGYVFDDGFAQCAAVSICSLLENHTKTARIKLWIFDDGISEENRGRFKELADKYGREVKFVDVSRTYDFFEQFGLEKWREKYSTYIKMIIPKLLPPEVGRLTMLDADTVIVGDMEELERMDLEGYPCAMALDGIHADFHKYSDLGNAALYNGGLLVYNVKEWLEQNIEYEIFSYWKKVRAHLMLGEEETISIVLKDKIKRIDARYNFITQYYLYDTPKYFKRFKWDTLGGDFYTLEEILDAKRDVRMYHCIDTFTNRPWDKNNCHPFSGIYDAYLEKTPWKDMGKEKKDMDFRQKTEYYLRKYLPEALSKYLYYIGAKAVYTKRAEKYYRQ